MKAIWKHLGFSPMPESAAACSDEETRRQRRIDEVRAMLAEITAEPARSACAADHHGRETTEVRDRELCCG